MGGGGGEGGGGEGGDGEGGDGKGGGRDIGEGGGGEGGGSIWIEFLGVVRFCCLRFFWLVKALLGREPHRHFSLGPLASSSSSPPSPSSPSVTPFFAST